MTRDPAPGPALRARSLAPDLGRGLMLLLIAVAHAPAFAGAAPLPVDHAAQFVKALVADNLARTLFVFLFGYGLGQLAYRQEGEGVGWPATRKQLRRRGWWLIMIGFLHTVILVPLDIIAFYGVALVLLVPLVQARDRVLLRTAVITLVPMCGLLAWQTALAYQAIMAGRPTGMAGYLEPDLPTHLLASLPTWPFETVLGTVAVVPGMLVGLWAARRRLLDEPGRHLPLLRRVAVIGLITAFAGRMPGAMIAGGLWSPDAPAARWAAAVAHDLTGFAGGLALAAAIGLLAHVLGSARNRLITAVVALGRRSLTFYLFQSLIWLLLFYPFTLGLAGRIGAAASIMIAVVVWLVSLALADLLRRAGHRGPLEVLLRRLVAGRARVGGSPEDRPTVASRSG